MEDQELAAIRAARLQELKSSSATNNPSTGTSSINNKENAESDAKDSFLARILDNAARERLSRISIVKKEKAAAVENLLLRMAQTGQIQQKVTESQLINLLEQIPSQAVESKIKFSRRAYSDDEDDFDF